MDINEIIYFLEKNGLTEAEELKNEDNYTVIKFYYDFDKDEIEAARSYANEESDYEAESDTWYSEYYVPYLKDLAADEVEAVLEDVSDEFELMSKFILTDIEYGNNDSITYIAVFTEDMDENELEEILTDFQ